MKAQIMHSRMVNFKSIHYAQQLNIYAETGHALSLEDWQLLQQQNVYINIIFSPGVTSPIEITIPIGSQLISLDYNTLNIFQPRERLSIVLHEIGHALNPQLTGSEAEFIADDYAIDRGFREDLISSLNYCITNFPLEFDKPITHERIQRAQKIQA